MFYLLHRFVRECKNDLSVDIVPDLIGSVRELLRIEVELPEADGGTSESELISDAVSSSDSQQYLFETVGVLTSLLFKEPEKQRGILSSIVDPLLDELSISLKHAQRDAVAIVKAHHAILALGNVAKGFPDYPSPVPEGYIMPPLEIFAGAARAILVCLEAMNVFQVVRDAVRGLKAPFSSEFSNR